MRTASLPSPARRAERVEGRRLASSWTRSAGAAASVVLVGALAWPMLFTSSSFGGDWLHHLWFIWHQSLSIRANHVPSLFLDTPFSVYYPQYAFYGGTIYALTGALALVPGSSPATAYVFTYVVGLMVAYGGWYWIGHMAGLGRWLAHAPGLVFVTSASYLTLIYGRGDWPEFLGISMIPLMIAAGASIMTASRLHIAPALALAGSSIIFFGSHSLTILWASTIFGLAGLITIVCVPDARRWFRPSGVARVVALIVPSLLVSAWYLLPLAAYTSRTQVGHGYSYSHETLRATIGIVSWGNLFTLSRAESLSEVPGFVLSLPVLAIAWTLASIAILLYPFRREARMRILLIFACITIAVFVLMTHLGMLLALPKPYSLLQFSYRLESYVLIGLSAVVLIVLALAESGGRRMRLWRWTIAPVLVVSAIGAIQQVDAYPRAIARRYVTLGVASQAFAQNFRDYSDESLPLVNGNSLPRLVFSPAEVHDDRVSVPVHLRVGQRVSTNIDTGPYLVHVTGASIVGRNQEGFLVLAMAPVGADRGAVRPLATTSTETISLSPADGLPVVLGRILTLLGVTVLAVQMSVLLIRRSRRAASG
jgi:hypothetical protein